VWGGRIAWSYRRASMRRKKPVPDRKFDDQPPRHADRRTRVAIFYDLGVGPPFETRAPLGRRVMYVVTSWEAAGLREAGKWVRHSETERPTACPAVVDLDRALSASRLALLHRPGGSARHRNISLARNHRGGTWALVEALSCQEEGSARRTQGSLTDFRAAPD